MVHPSEITNAEFREATRVYNRLRKETEQIRDKLTKAYHRLAPWEELKEILVEWSNDIHERFDGKPFSTTKMVTYIFNENRPIFDEEAADEYDHDICRFSACIYFYPEGYGPKNRGSEMDQSDYYTPLMLGSISLSGYLNRSAAMIKSNYWNSRNYRSLEITYGCDASINRGTRWKEVARTSKKTEETKIVNQSYDYEVTFYKVQTYKVWVKGRNVDEARSAFEAGLLETNPVPDGEPEMKNRSYSDLSLKFYSPQEEALKMMIKGEDMTR